MPAGCVTGRSAAVVLRMASVLVATMGALVVGGGLLLLTSPTPEEKTQQLGDVKMRQTDAVLLRNLPYVLIAIGAFVFLISIVAFFSVPKERTFLLSIFIALTIISIALQVFAIIKITRKNQNEEIASLKIPTINNLQLQNVLVPYFLFSTSISSILFIVCCVLIPLVRKKSSSKGFKSLNDSYI